MSSDQPKTAELSPQDIAKCEQAFDLLAEHIATGDRVIAAMERAQTEFPKKLEQVLAEHRQRTLQAAPQPAPAPLAAIQTAPSQHAIHAWGVGIVLAVLVAGVVVAAAILMR